ncbi:hypothetical protein TEA_017202 [Camellia sinensis var. sinensis]|uniref:Uncharacterized protein n=1 Tax=Camellia sinensis var. sinensis TaxID=542762 RepID=A0A4S4ENJ2_CAMSN|nr:hypothetical protein TEA_017202 [Camellia sinensis var. sinensis]
MEKENYAAAEIEEATTDDGGDAPTTTAAAADSDESSLLLPNPPRTRTVRTKVPEVEVHLYRRGKGPIDVFKSGLGGWDQNQLEIGDILDKYGFKSVFAFNPQTGRGAPIRFNPRNGRSVLPYNDGSVIFIDGEPKPLSNASSGDLEWGYLGQGTLLETKNVGDQGTILWGLSRRARQAACVLWRESMLGWIMGAPFPLEEQVEGTCLVGELFDQTEET